MEQAENPGRERILARIRAALRTPAPMHAPSGPPRSVFAPVTDALARFEKECAGNHTELVVTPDMNAAGAAVASVLASLPAGEIFAQDAPELRRILRQGAAMEGRGFNPAATPPSPSGVLTSEVAGANRPIRWSNVAPVGAAGPDETSQATITLAETLVAQTGSVFVSAACGGRGASVVAPVHIVVAGIGQLVPDLDAAFARLIERGVPTKNSFLCLITGSSRTSDIEKIMVLGAHGPRRLVVVLSQRWE
jgi:L-lactate dehydrogenase complex protein LldG